MSYDDYDNLVKASRLVEDAHAKLLAAFTAAACREAKDHAGEMAAEAAEGRVTGDTRTIAVLAKQAFDLFMALDKEVSEWSGEVHSDIFASKTAR